MCGAPDFGAASIYMASPADSRRHCPVKSPWCPRTLPPAVKLTEKKPQQVSRSDRKTRPVTKLLPNEIMVAIDRHLFLGTGANPALLLDCEKSSTLLTRTRPVPADRSCTVARWLQTANNRSSAGEYLALWPFRRSPHGAFSRARKQSRRRRRPWLC